MNNWFEVDREGLKALQAGKPKTFIINELIQNAWDEDITTCKVKFGFKFDLNIITVAVEDDNPEGFKDITHAYTLFADTYKRRDPTKRGRFNLGEKQVLSICESAIVSTTKGLVTFDEKGRQESKPIRDKGSVIQVEFKGTHKEYKELIEHAKKLLVPEGIQYIVDGDVIPPKTVFKTFEASLDTEILKDGAMVSTSRKTMINLIKSNSINYIYEMGIPVMKTDCTWSIDIQQKIPLAVDRETIRPYYLQYLYAIVLNNTYEEIPKDDISAVWVRSGMKDERCNAGTVNAVMTKRYGEKFCIANPNDKASMDEALSRGYNVIYGSELSKEEWNHLKETVDIQSSTALFGDSNLELAKPVEPNLKQKQVGEYAKKIAKRILDIDITVKYVDNPKASMLACYGGRVLTFNVGKLNNGFFDKPISIRTTDLIIHELGHENGWHVEYDYHQLLTKLGAELTILALNEPEFFEVN